MATKPVISFVDNKRPTELDGNLPIVKKSDGNLYANKTELVAYIDTLWVHPDSDTYLYIKAHDDEEFIYATKDDVPADTVTATCGRKVIEYSG